MDEKTMKEGSHHEGKNVCEGGDCEGGACGGECGGCRGACTGRCGCNCLCHKAFPMLVIVFGVTFLLGALNVLEVETVNLIWPILVISIGAKKLFAGMCKCC